MTSQLSLGVHRGSRIEAALAMEAIMHHDQLVARSETADFASP